MFNRVNQIKNKARRSQPNALNNCDVTTVW